MIRQEKTGRQAILKKAEKLESPNAFFDAYSSTPFFMPCGEKIDVDAAKADGADTAVFVMARIAGENKDRFDKEGVFLSPKKKEYCWHRYVRAIKMWCW